MPLNARPIWKTGSLKTAARQEVGAFRGGCIKMTEDPKTQPHAEIGSALVVVSTAYTELRKLNSLPHGVLEAIPDPNSLNHLIITLTSLFTPATFSASDEGQKTWELVGLVYRDLGRHFEALSIFRKLYYQELMAQEETGKRCHKGTSLCWMSDCYLAIGYPLMSLRYLMLTLVEDAIAAEGQPISPRQTGVYWRLVFRGWLSEDDLNRYAARIYDLYTSDPNEALFPESILQKLDNNWLTWGPTPPEAGIFDVNVRYVQYLMTRLGVGSGNILEQLAEYLLACMPGCRTMRHVISISSDYDVVCAMEGLESDFRSELGRYFVCECKDWRKSVGFPSFAKFCRVLDSVKAHFGIIFSRYGISGTGRREDAELEQMKVFQDRGMVIIVLTEADLTKVIEGTNLISLLRDKYEKVRLSLPEKRIQKITRATAKRRRSSQTPRAL
jgi:hypothetical protein